MENSFDIIHRDPGLPVDSPTPSYWQMPPHKICNSQSPELPSETNVVIIGSGITGTSVAYHLLNEKPGLSVTILEARTATSGATGRNGGHIKDVPFAEYDELKEAFGKEAAVQITRFKMGQLDAILEASKSLDAEEAARSEIRRVETVNAFYDTHQWAQSIARRERWLADFPEERARFGIYEGEEAQKVGQVHV
jgi:glycine/D-amino acid oxidase-like deaminating enzyme